MRKLLCLTAALMLSGAARAAAPAPDPNAERIEITATRIPEDVDTIPSSITIVTGADLRARGAWNLRTALQQAAGLDIAPGGDGGPAGSVPDLWGLREFDAFLLVVDGVPWGGAFVPALATLDLDDVDRIEILRGPAPVMYGATSFVGVIHVLHREPGSERLTAAASAGSYGSGSLRARTPLPSWGRLRSSVGGSVERSGYREDRTQSDRGVMSWRGGISLAGGGLVRLQANGFWLQQDPGSPHPRAGERLSSDVPLGSNHNPRHARLDEQRLQLSAGYDRPTGRGLWSTQISFSDSSREALRGFLTDISEMAPNAVGFRQDTDVTDVYFDTHLALTKGTTWKGVVGIDHLYGRGFAQGGDFDYFVRLDGGHAPDGDSLNLMSDNRIRDERNFSGAYGQLEWLPTARWRFQIGGRINRTAETRESREKELGGPPATEEDDSRTVVRGSGSAGVTWTAWQSGPNATRLYASYSETYKPAVIDFGIESEGEILEPETASSVQVGAKNRLAGGRVDVEVSLFQMDFENLVVSQPVAGLPTLVNAGEERFRGAEVEADWRIRQDLIWRTAYSLHDASFRDFENDFDGTVVQLRGNKLEMSARDMATTGVLYSPAGGWFGSTQISYVGSRYLNKRNTAEAPDYTTWSAGAGYRGEGWDVHVQGENLNDRRPPVSESEIGDAQYYTLPARRVIVSLVWRGR